MAKKLYRSGNYIIADNGEIRTDYAMSSSYTERNGNFTLTNRERQTLVIEFNDAINWVSAEFEGFPYTEDKMRSFLRENTSIYSPLMIRPIDGDGGTVITDPPFGDGTAR
tara:strand:+ start:4700 stop:5029 length:330 start_codon:yes stop_codon:yes gene_type:complete